MSNLAIDYANCLVGITAYISTVGRLFYKLLKGVMGTKDLFCCTINLRGSVIDKTNTAKTQEKFETAQKFWGGLAHFKKEVEGQAVIKFLMRDIVGQFIDWIAVYPADRSVWPYTQKSKSIITPSGRLGNPIIL